MIRTEISVFVALFAAGCGAGVLASFLLALGSGSRVARAVTDALAPIAVGVIFFFALKGAASGVLRLYSVLAFLLGGASARWIVGRTAPALFRAIERAKVPIKSLEEKLSKRIDRRLAPLRDRRAVKRALLMERRTALRAQKEQERLNEARERARKRAPRASG